MELITAYLYNTSPFDTKGISPTTFHNLKNHDWYMDIRSTPKFQIFNKRFKIQDKWYRTIIRFTQKDDVYELDVPIPFIITETEAQDQEETVFKDVKTYHGRKVGNTLGYLEQGIPVKLIDEVINDLKLYTVYRMKVTEMESDDNEMPSLWEF